ncbi:MAG: inositol monophosphatase, partial [Clostridiales bacterium]|nr:inositol monophosphatase [Clostridiales bacterium]
MYSVKRLASVIRVKGVSDYVTEVDFLVQHLVKNRLHELYPEIQFMGEEKDNADIDFSGDVWILDPVDGTLNLIHDFRESTLSLGLWHDGRVCMGLVYQPYTDEMFTAEYGGGAFLNGNPIHVSAETELKKSLISTGTTPYQKEKADENFRDFKEIFLRCADIRRLGSAALELAFVAAGRLEVFYERGLKPWDFAAGLLLVQEAGGRVTGFDGRPV